MSVRLPDLSQAVSREKEGQRANEERREKNFLRGEIVLKYFTNC